MKKNYTYDDVCLIPQMTMLRSRSDADTVVPFGRNNESKLLAPFISANMDTVTGPEMAAVMWDVGGIGALHRFNTVKEACRDFLKVKEINPIAECIVSVGVHDYEDRCTELAKAGAKYFVVDIAHGHSIAMKETPTWMKNNLRLNNGDRPYIIAGNVATPLAVRHLSEWGADVIKVGIGPGACCKTRIVTGHGVPQFSAVLDCAREASRLGVKTIADGGIRNSGDIVKAFAAGTDFVMLGSLLSGTKEAPGEMITKVTERGDKQHFKVYRGMASDSAREDRGKAYNDQYSYVPAAEGVKTLVPYKGTAHSIIMQLKKGLKSGMSYCNATKVDEIKDCALFELQTSSGFSEGKPHILG